MYRLTLATCFVLTCLAAGLSTGPVAAKDWTKVRIGFEGTYPPFNSINANNKLVGFDVDIAKALCAEMGVTCRYFSAHKDAGLATLTDWLIGRNLSEDEYPDIVTDIDAIVSSMWITEQRKRQLGFTRPYYNTPHAVVVSGSFQGSLNYMKDFEGLPIGTVDGSAADKYVRKRLPKALPVTFASIGDLQAALADGSRVKVALADPLEMYPWAKSAAGSCCKAVGRFPPDTAADMDGAGAGIAVRREDDDLRQMFDAALARILANGTYDTIAAKYFDFDIYGPPRK